eukprot:gnl/MRDRNA2_/MRDRNA2_137173_c0_seq1.p1 gnl/MRDRNA2_/MRDRNA2_137173_c0~~gnl/MRDRNA2_/MRDRNA2_137173_c0_seq1.p1  ORF type:complete len:299 (-),score=37.66 gnl/MRDRNA2_/MRDRNA2_137173_c0_seq1:40-936(-)
MNPQARQPFVNAASAPPMQSYPQVAAPLAAAPVAQAMAPPGQQSVAPMHMQFPSAQQSALQQAYAELNSLPRVQIKQLRQWIEALTGFERNNRYVVRTEDGRDIFFVKENTNCCARNFLHGACKPWSMDIYLIGPAGIAGGVESMVPFIHIERPCTCTCLCFQRPEVFVTNLATGAPIGSILEPFTCCNLKFIVRDVNGANILDSTGHCCQCGLFCPCPCGGCPGNKIDFPIIDASSGSTVGHMQKIWMWGDCIQCLGEWDNYWVHFGVADNPDYKVLLMALAVFVQMRLFDRRNQQN